MRRRIFKFTVRRACHAKVHWRGEAATHVSLFGAATANLGSCCSGVYMHILSKGDLPLMIPAHCSVYKGREGYHNSAEAVVSGEDERLTVGFGCCCETSRSGLCIMPFDWIQRQAVAVFDAWRVVVHIVHTLFCAKRRPRGVHSHSTCGCRGSACCGIQTFTHICYEACSGKRSTFAE